MQQHTYLMPTNFKIIVKFPKYLNTTNTNNNDEIIVIIIIITIFFCVKSKYRALKF